MCVGCIRTIFKSKKNNIINDNNINVLILGFFNRKNFGDDSFNIIFKQLFNKIDNRINLTIMSTDDCKRIFKDTDILIIGGGEVLNNYFIDKILYLIKQSNYNNPIYAISCELSSFEIVDQGKLDFIDYFYIRNLKDSEKLASRFGNNNVKFINDIVFYNDFPYTSCYYKKSNIVSFCLAQSIYKDNIKYDSYLNNICEFITYLINKNIYVKLLPFNISNNPDESDYVLNDNIMNKIKNKKYVSNIIFNNNENYKTQLKKVLDIIDNSELIICSRYHAHIFSILRNKPIISISHTKKTKDLIEQLDLNELIVIPDMDNSKRPQYIDSNILIDKYNYVIKNYKDIVYKFEKINNNLYSEENYYNIIQNIITSQYKRLTKPYYVDPDIKEKYALDLIKNIKNRYNISDFTNININDNIKNKIIQYILINITKDPFFEYHYGLSQQIFKNGFDIKESIKWLFNDYNSNYKTVNNFTPVISIKNIKISKKINLSYIKQNNLEGYHRSGWSYVVNNLGIFDNINSTVLLDTYLDKTFHWGCNAYIDADIIPYKQPFIGFLHHTLDIDNYTTYNVDNMLNNPNFQESLKYCKGIFVLSKYLRDLLEVKILDKFNKKIIIESLIHPTEIPDLKFTIDKFNNNHNKKIINIGAWLRNCYSIYEIKLNNNIKKAVLVGKDMNNYIKPVEIDLRKDINHLLNEINTYNDTIYNNGICRDINSLNKYIKYLCKYIKKLQYNFTLEEIIDIIEDNQKSVEIISKLSNYDYDILLSENIVFLHLIDMSACNTVIECIVRNTPIVINKLPAVVELLGNNYPLYYESLNDIDKLVTYDNINLAHKYLVSIDKTKFTIEYFINMFMTSEIYNNL
jgi:polysaccharide pyruvyl transferase WcaK-like protein